MQTARTMAPVNRPVWPALKRGFSGTCPNCGKGRMFKSYLKVNDNCPVCSNPLHCHRADDAPPYFTLLVTGHIIGATLLLELDYGPALSMLAQTLIWCALAIVLSLTLLPVFKGGLIAYQWALRMHGFEDEPEYPV